MSLRLVYLGTSDFALPAFAALYDTPHTVAALVTQPERTGKGHHTVAPSPIKQTALNHATKVLQPENVNVSEALNELRDLQADLFVVAAYGQILSPEFLTIPRLGTINIHASLLPKYRGASPVEYAVWKGEAETGVSIIRVVPALDAGAILGVVRTPILPTETAGELELRLSQLAVPVTLSVIDVLEAGTVQEIPQDPALVTVARKLKKTQGAIDWSQSAWQIDCHVRAMQPWPNAFTFVHLADRAPLRVQVKQVRECPAESATGLATGRSPGTVLRADKAGLAVQSGSGPLEIVSLQPDGKRAMSAADFLRGNAVQPGDHVGP